MMMDFAAYLEERFVVSYKGDIDIFDSKEEAVEAAKCWAELGFHCKVSKEMVWIDEESGAVIG